MRAPELKLVLLFLLATQAVAQTRVRTQEETNEITRSVSGMLGLDTARGDQLTTAVLPFASTRLEAEARRRREQEAREEIVTSVVINLAKGIAVVLALLVLKAIVGAIGRGVAREEELALAAQVDLPSEVREEVPETPHDVLINRVARLIIDRPEDSARAIRTMKDHSNSVRSFIPIISAALCVLCAFASRC